MKRAVILFTLIFFFLEIGGVYSQQLPQEKDYKKLKVNGGFKECKVYWYEFKEGVLDSNSKFIIKAHKIDSTGNKIESINFKSDFTCASKYNYKYDEYGNILEIVSYYTWGWDNIFDTIYSSKTVYKNNNMGKHLESIEYRNKYVETTEFVYESKEYVLFKDYYKYDDKENLVELLEYDYEKGNEFICWYLWKYDEKGNLTEELKYTSNPSANHRYIYKYNEKGYKVLEVVIRDSPNIGLNNLKYDDRGNLIEYIFNKQCKYEKKKTFKTDKNGNLIEEIPQDRFCFNGRKTFKYDNIGNMIEEVDYSEDDDITKSIFNYDCYRNIIEKIVYNEKDKPQYKWEYIYSK